MNKFNLPNPLPFFYYEKFLVTEFKIVGNYGILLKVNNRLRSRFLNKIILKMQIWEISKLNQRSILQAYNTKINNRTRSKLMAKYDILLVKAKYFGRKLSNSN